MPTKAPTRKVVKVKTKRLPNGTVVRVTYYRRTKPKGKRNG